MFVSFSSVAWYRRCNRVVHLHYFYNCGRVSNDYKDNRNEKNRKPVDQADIHHITRTYLYNVDPLDPHFYLVKRGLQGIHYFLISAQKYRL